MQEPRVTETSGRSPVLGRALALAVVGLFLMVALGVFWVWQRAHREKSWRDQINAIEPIQPAAPR
ncbi:MAG: hypothetical protein JNK85_11260 [Verrucomicrobiales bacterium]|nr:hypothetical protein [Verrucomicrobiales bacterium]